MNVNQVGAALRLARNSAFAATAARVAGVPR
jgi:hypothetical protein